MDKKIILVAILAILSITVNTYQAFNSINQQNTIDNQNAIIEKDIQLLLQAKDLLEQQDAYITELQNKYEPSEGLDFPIKADSYTTITDKDGNVKYYSEHPAIFTIVGKDFVKTCLGNFQCGATAFNYVAMGGNTSAMGVGDTTLANEFSTCGLTRATGTYTSLGTGNWKIEKIFPITGTCNSINSTGIFNASTSGTMMAEDTISNTNVISGDTLNQTWTFQIS